MVQSRAPLIIAIALLLLPLLYVGSYCAIVVPGGLIADPTRSTPYVHPTNYRIGDQWSRAIFWPLEQLDRKLRPQAWNRF